MTTISSRIREALTKNGMKQIDLSKKTGINRSNISYYCSGEFEPKGQNLYKIADALGVTVAWLIGADNCSNTNTNDNVVKACNMIEQLTPENLELATAVLKAMLDKQ